MRVFTYTLGIILTLFAVVQFNDPDFFIWIPAYLIPALLSFLFTHKKPGRILVGSLSLIYLAAAIALFPPSVSSWISTEEEVRSLGMKLPGIEEARESMGLFICFLVLLLFWIKGRK